jgi:hypothetical protein
MLSVIYQALYGECHYADFFMLGVIVQIYPDYNKVGQSTEVYTKTRAPLLKGKAQYVRSLY